MYWNSQENRTPMSKTLSGKRAISEASPFDQWREVQFIGSVAPAAVVVGLDPAEYDLANLIPLHGGELEPVDQFLLQRCEKTLHARVVKAAMRAAHALPDGTEPGKPHRAGHRSTGWHAYDASWRSRRPPHHSSPAQRPGTACHRHI